MAEAPAGSVIGVGTEIHLVKRLDDETPDKTVVSLDPLVCPCSTMFRIDAAHLAWVLEGLVDGEVRNRITVDEETASWARVALERMLATPELTGSAPGVDRPGARLGPRRTRGQPEAATLALAGTFDRGGALLGRAARVAASGVAVAFATRALVVRLALVPDPDGRCAAADGTPVASPAIPRSGARTSPV